MSCIACEEVPKRINNIFRDEELKDKFENLTGITILQNIFICDPCSQILIQSYSFKEKCIEVYERELLRDETPQSSNIVKTEVFENYHEHLDLSKEESFALLQEEHLEEDNENGETFTLDPLQAESPKRRVRLRYSANDKINAINLAEQTNNRQAAKILSIDESCIRKWRLQKERIQSVPQNCKSIRGNNPRNKNKNMTRESQGSPEQNQTSEQIETECVIQTEILDESMPETQQSVREVRTRKSYSSGEKLQVISYAEVTGNRQASKVYNIDESCIRKWRNQKDMLIEINEERGTRRKPNLRFPDVESRLKNFVLQKMNQGIMLKPSEIKTESVRIAKELNIRNFKGTSSYIFKFMERYHFPSTRGKSTTQSSVKNIKREGSAEITVDIL